MADETDTIIEQSRVQEPQPQVQPEATPAQPAAAPAQEKSALRRAGEAFLDSKGSIFSTIAAAANTPGYQRSVAENEAAISTAKLKKQSADVAQLYEAGRLADEAIILHNRARQSDLALTQAEMASMMSNSTLGAMSVLNSIPEYSSLLDDGNRKYVQDSVEFREYSTFKAMKEIAPQALQELSSGKPGRNLDMLNKLAASVGCRFDLDEKGKIWLVDDKTQKRYEASPENLAKYEQSAVAQLQKKAQEAQALDSSITGGHYGGEAQTAVLEAYMDAGGLQLPEALKYWGNLMKYAQADPKAYDAFAINQTIQKMQRTYGDKADPLKPADFKKLSPSDQSALNSIMQALQQRHGIEMQVSEDQTEYEVFDKKQTFIDKPSCTAHEFLQQLQGQDKFGGLLQKDLDMMTQKRVAAEQEAQAKAAMKGIKNAMGVGEDASEKKIDFENLTAEQRMDYFEMTKGKSAKWKPDDYKSYQDNLDDFYERGKRLGVFDDDKQLKDGIDVKHYEDILQLSEFEEELVPSEQQRVLPGVIAEIEEKLKQKIQESRMKKSRKAQGSGLQDQMDLIRWAKSEKLFNTPGYDKFRDLPDSKKAKLMQEVLAGAESREVNNIAPFDGRQNASYFCQNLCDSNRKLFKRLLESYKGAGRAIERQVKEITKQDLINASKGIFN